MSRKYKNKSRKIKPMLRRIKRTIKAQLEDDWNKSNKIDLDTQFKEDVQKLLNEFLKPISYIQAIFYINEDRVKLLHEVENEKKNQNA